MLRLLSRRGPRMAALQARINRVQVALYQISKMDPETDTTFSAVTDYGSYKANIFTHRLPESTAEQSPALVALHNRLKLPESFKLSTLSQALNCDQSTGLVNNYGLSILGSNLMAYYVSEHLLMNFPRLPLPVHNEATNAYMGPYTLAEIGREWGIEADTLSKLQKYLANEPEFMVYGRLRYLSEAAKENVGKEEGVEELSETELGSFDKNTNTFLTKEEEAYSQAVKAVVGGIYTHAGEPAAKQFIQAHILSRKVPLQEMFQFRRPTRELTRLLAKLQLEDPLEIRLIAESGRLSTSAMYVVGAFCGGHKLGEGIGGSLKEAQTRCVVNALLSYYLYTPVNEEGNQIKLPHEENYKMEGIVGSGDVAI